VAAEIAIDFSGPQGYASSMGCGISLLRPTLLVLVLFAAPAAFACKCSADFLAPLSADPGTAETALLGKAEASGIGRIFRVEASWTKYTSALVLPGGTKCDLRPAVGRRLLLLSVYSLAWFDENKTSPTICDSILLEPAKAEKAVARLAARTDYGNHFSYNPSWGWCRKDSDCVLAPGVCGGTDAVNLRSRAEHEGWRKRTAPRVDCVSGTPVKNAAAKCSDNFCAVSGPQIR